MNIEKFIEGNQVRDQDQLIQIQISLTGSAAILQMIQLDLEQMCHFQ
jgi:hypothetical protein